MAETAETPTHSASSSIFSKERTYRLEPDALTWTDAGGKAGRVPYAGIERVHIYSQPPYRGQLVRRTILRGAFPGKVVIDATHYRGFGNIEDRSTSYFPFVEALLARVGAANPNLAIRVGQPWPLYIFWVVMFVIFILMVPLMLAILFGGDGNAGALGGLALAAVFIAMTWKVVRRGRPRRAGASALYDLDLAGGHRRQA